MPDIAQAAFAVDAQNHAVTAAIVGDNEVMGHCAYGAYDTKACYKLLKIKQ